MRRDQHLIVAVVAQSKEIRLQNHDKIYPDSDSMFDGLAHTFK